MSRAPVFPVEEKGPVVLSIVAGEVSVAEVARRAKISEPSVGNWKRQFLEARRAGLVAGRPARRLARPTAGGRGRGPRQHPGQGYAIARVSVRDREHAPSSALRHSSICRVWASLR